MYGYGAYGAGYGLGLGFGAGYGGFGAYGAVPDEAAITEAKNKYTANITEAATNMTNELNNRAAAREQMIRDMAARQIEVQTAQINARAEQEVARIQQQATAQQHAIDQRRQMLDHQVSQRALQLTTHSNQADILNKSLKDMPVGSYVPPAMGLGFGGYGAGFGGYGAGFGYRGSAAKRGRRLCMRDETRGGGRRPHNTFPTSALTSGTYTGKTKSVSCGCCLLRSIKARSAVGRAGLRAGCIRRWTQSRPSKSTMTMTIALIMEHGEAV